MIHWTQTFNKHLMYVQYTSCVQGQDTHCLKSALIRSYSSLYIPALRTEYAEIRSIFPYTVRMRENRYQNNSKYGHFSHIDWRKDWLKLHLAVTGQTPKQTVRLTIWDQLFLSFTWSSLNFLIVHSNEVNSVSFKRY